MRTMRTLSNSFRREEEQTRFVIDGSLYTKISIDEAHLKFDAD